MNAKALARPKSAHRPPPQRWRRRKDARPAEILEAALAEFATRGFAATRLDQVATRAGISKGTLYLYFDGKAALFQAVVRATIVPNLAAAEVAVRGFRGTSADLMRAVLTRFAGLTADPRIGAVIKLVMSEAGNFPDLARFYFDEVVARGLRLFGGVIARGIAAGEFRAVDVEDTVRLTLAPMLLAAVWRHTFEAAAGRPLDVAKFVALHLDILLRGLAKERSA